MIRRKRFPQILICAFACAFIPFPRSLPALDQAMKISDFAFLAGKWTGEIKAGKIEQYWSAPQAGLMMGMFHLYDKDKTLVLEFMSLRQTPDGVALQVRHFGPELIPGEKGDAILLRGTRREGETFLFENPVHNSPKRSSVKRLGNDRLLNRSEIIRDDGAVSVIEVELVRSRVESDPLTKDLLNTSYLTPSGERILRHEVIVDASLEEAWAAFTTSEGLKSFVAPVVEVELKTGGKFHSNYSVGSKLGDPGTIYNQVLSFIPLKMFSIKIGLTDQFPAALRQAGTLFAVIEFEELTKKKIRVRESMIGWKSAPEWDQTYEFFDRGNAFTLRKLQQRFVEGPVDWGKTGTPKKDIKE